MPPTSARQSASTRAYAHTKSAIMSGRYAGGTIISEGDVASEIGASRTPVREAFLRLQSEGWMQLFPKRGALVVPVLDGERRNVLEARLLVEGNAARQVSAEPATARDAADAMRAVLVTQEEAWHAGDIAAFAHQDALFHRALVEHAGNPLLTAFYGSLQERQERMARGSVRMRPAAAAAILAEHRELTELVESGHHDAFTGCLQRHFESVYGDFE